MIIACEMCLFKREPSLERVGICGVVGLQTDLLGRAFALELLGKVIEQLSASCLLHAASEIVRQVVKLLEPVLHGGDSCRELLPWL